MPFGLFGTVWSYLKLREIGIRTREPIDWLGNATFASGLILVMIGITYGIQPYGTSTMGWRSPLVLSTAAAAPRSSSRSSIIEHQIAHPMFRLPLFRIRAFTFGVFSSFLSAIARGGLMFMLIIWLQGIWLPSHGYSFASTPLWAGIHMLPLTFGILIAGPLSGFLSDRHGSRLFTTGGMVGSAVGFGLLELLPVDFSYLPFAAILFLLGMSMGAFASPNRAGVMNSLPARDRGAGAGMNQTFQNSAQVLSIGIFFTLMIVGLSGTLPHSLATGLEAHGVPASTATSVAHLPPVSVLFAAFLGYNPVQRLLPAHVLHQLPHSSVVALEGRGFFPHLITEPFRSGLHEAFAFAITACLVAAVVSWQRGGRYIAEETPGEGLQRAGRGQQPGASASDPRRRHVAACVAAPGLERERAAEPDDEQGIDRMEDPDRRHAFAGERRARSRRERGSARPSACITSRRPSRPARANRNRKQAAEEDEVAERDVEVEAVIELLVGQRLCLVGVACRRRRPRNPRRQPGRSPRGRRPPPRSDRRLGRRWSCPLLLFQGACLD